MKERDDKLGRVVQLASAIASIYFASKGLREQNTVGLLFGIWLMLLCILTTLHIKFGLEHVDNETD